MDTTFDPGTTLGDVQRTWFTSMALESDGSLWLGGHADAPGWSSTDLVRLLPNGRLDDEFSALAGPILVQRSAAHIAAMALQPDGGIVVGGSFDFIGTEVHPNLARLLPDGTADASFAVDTANSKPVAAMILQGDRKILIGTRIPEQGGCGFLIRFHPDGSQDTSFESRWSKERGMRFQCIALQADGRILAGGEFGGGLARFHSNGRLDATFRPPVLPAYDGQAVNAIVVEPGGEVLVGGTSAVGLFRLHSDGSLDSSFGSAVEIGREVTALFLQPDGRILVGVDGGCLPGAQQGFSEKLIRLNSNGRHDASFNTSIPGKVIAMTMEPNGWILAGTCNSTPGSDSGVYRLNNDGTLDQTFHTSVRAHQGVSSVETLVIQSNGQVLAGGSFSTVNGIAARDIVRLEGQSPPRLSVVAPFAQDTFHIELSATPERVYWLESSTDLNHWSLATCVTNLSSGHCQFAVPLLMAPHHFYRVRASAPAWGLTALLLGGESLTVHAAELQKGTPQTPSTAAAMAGTYICHDGNAYRVVLTINTDGTYGVKGSSCLKNKGNASGLGTWKLTERRIVLTPSKEDGWMKEEPKVFDVLKFKGDWILVRADWPDYYNEHGVTDVSCFQRQAPKESYTPISDEELPLLKPFQAIVEQREPCAAYIKSSDATRLCIGGPGATPEVAGFVQVLQEGQTYSLPDAFLKYRKDRNEKP